MKLAIKEKTHILESLRHSSSKINKNTNKYNEIKILLLKVEEDIKCSNEKIRQLNKFKTEKYKNRVKAIEDYIYNAPKI